MTTLNKELSKRIMCIEQVGFYSCVFLYHMCKFWHISHISMHHLRVIISIRNSCFSLNIIQVSPSLLVNFQPINCSSKNLDVIFDSSRSLTFNFYQKVMSDILAKYIWILTISHNAQSPLCSKILPYLTCIIFY